MADIAELGFKIDSKDLKDLNTELERTPVAAAKADSWVTKLAEATKKVPGGATQVVAALVKVAEANDNVADATDGVGESVVKTARSLGQYNDALTAAFRKAQDLRNLESDWEQQLTKNIAARKAAAYQVNAESSNITANAKVSSDAIKSVQETHSQAAKKINDDMEKSTLATKVLGSAMDELKTMALRAGAVVAGAFALKEFIAATTEAQDSLAKLDAVFKATGGASGQTMESMVKLSNEMQNLTTYSSGAVQSSEAIMQTFTRVSGEAFPRAIKASADLAALWGSDLPSAARMVGHALEDPIQGMMSLRRAGIILSDQQKEQIKQFAAVQDSAGAMNVVLKAIEASTAGTAAAMRNTLGGALTALKNAFGDTLAQGSQATSKMVASINALITAISDPRFKQFVDLVGSFVIGGLQRLVDVTNLAVEAASNLVAVGNAAIDSYAKQTLEAAGMGSAIQQAAGATVEFSDVVTAVRNKLNEERDKGTWLSDLIKTIENLIDAAKRLSAVDIGTAVANSFITLTGAIQGTINVVNLLIEKTKELIKEQTTATNTPALAAYNDNQKRLQAEREAAAAKFADDPLVQMFNKIGAAYSEIWGTIMSDQDARREEYLKKQEQTAVDAAKQFGQSYSDEMMANIGPVRTLGEEAGKAWAKGFESTSSVIVDVLTAAMTQAGIRAFAAGMAGANLSSGAKQFDQATAGGLGIDFNQLRTPPPINKGDGGGGKQTVDELTKINKLVDEYVAKQNAAAAAASAAAAGESLYNQQLTAHIIELTQKYKDAKLPMDAVKIAAQAALEANADVGKRMAEDAAKFKEASDRAVDAAQLEIDTLGMTAEKANAYKAAMTLLNEEKRLGLPISDEYKARILGEADAMGSAQEAARKMKEEFDLAKEVTKGFVHELVDGIRSGANMFETLQKAAMNALNKIADKLIDMAIDDLFANAFGGKSKGGTGVADALAKATGSSGSSSGSSGSSSGGLGKLFDNLGDKLSGAWDKTTEWFGNLFGSSGGTSQALAPTAGQMTTGSSPISSASGAIGGDAGSMGGIGGSGISALGAVGAGVGVLSGAMGLMNSKGTGDTVKSIGTMVGSVVSLIPGIGQIAGPIIMIASQILGGLIGNGTPQPIKDEAFGQLTFGSGGAFTTGGAWGPNANAKALQGPLGEVGKNIQGVFDLFGGLKDPSKAWGLALSSISMGGVPGWDFKSSSSMLVDPSGKQIPWRMNEDNMLNTGGAQVAIRSVLGGAVGDITETMRKGLESIQYDTELTFEKIGTAIGELMSYDAAIAKFGHDATAAEGAMQQITDSFAQYYELAAKYGLDTGVLDAEKNRLKLKAATENFAQPLQDQLLALKDPMAAELAEMDKWRKEAVDNNAYLVANVVGYQDQIATIEEIYGIKRKDIVEKYADEAAKALEAKVKEATDFAKDIQDQLLGIKNPQALELVQLDRWLADTKEKNTEYIATVSGYTDQALAIEELYGLKRVAIIEKYAKVANDFAMSITDELLGLKDPKALELLQLDRWLADTKDKNAEYLATVAGYQDQILAIEELYGLKRVAIIEKYLQPLDDLLKRLLPGGDLANVDQTATLAGLQATYSGSLAQALASPNDQQKMTDFITAAGNLADFAEKYFGGSTDYNLTRDQIIADTERLRAAGGGTVSNGAANDDSIAAGTPMTQLIKTVQDLTTQLTISLEQTAQLQGQVNRLLANSGGR